MFLAVPYVNIFNTKVYVECQNPLEVDQNAPTGNTRYAGEGFGLLCS